MRAHKQGANRATSSDLAEKVIQVARVSKKTKGGNQFGFSVLVVVGDKKGQVGVGLGKAPDVSTAVRKATKKAKKKMITIPLDGTTIPFAVEVSRGAGRVLLKPAPRGSGVIAGGPVRAVVEAAGVRDISSKILGSQNQASSVYATFAALKEIRRLVELKNIPLKSIAEVEAEEERKLKEAGRKKNEREVATTASTQDTAHSPAKRQTTPKRATAPVKSTRKTETKVADQVKAKPSLKSARPKTSGK